MQPSPSLSSPSSKASASLPPPPPYDCEIKDCAGTPRHQQSGDMMRSQQPQAWMVAVGLSCIEQANDWGRSGPWGRLRFRLRMDRVRGELLPVRFEFRRQRGVDCSVAQLD